MSQPNVEPPRAAPPVREPLPEGTVLRGMYTVGPVVGVGGFSLTYLAYQGSLHIPVAIKEFFPSGCVRRPEGIFPLAPWTREGFAAALDNFQREGATLGRFHHPGIVRVHGQFEENRSAYLVEELLEGESLGEGLQRAGMMAEQQALQVAHQMGLALMLVHAGGLVHSDIKPDNIFWTHQGRYVLLDFGVSRGYLSEKAAKEGMAAVSLGYSPPEQYDKNSKVTPQADVYALAATLYHLLTGRQTIEARRRVKGDRLTSIRSVNPTVRPEVEQAIFQALQLDLKKRTGSIRQFLEDLGLDTAPNAPAVFATPEFERVAEAMAHSGGVQAVALDSEHRRIFSAGKDGRISLWSWPDLQLLGTTPAHSQPITALACSPDGGYLVSGAQSGEIKLWDGAQGRELQTLNHAGPGVLRLAFHPDGGLIVAGFTDGRCALLGPVLPQPMAWQAHKGSVNGLDISPDGIWLATTADDKVVNFWRLPDGRFLRSIQAHEKLVQSVRFSPDGKLLLTGSNDLTARLWDLAANVEMRVLKGHKGMVWEAAFTSTPQLVVTVSADRCLRAFRVDTGRVALCSEAHEGWARVLAVDLTEPFVATGGADGHLRVWRMPPL